MKILPLVILGVILLPLNSLAFKEGMTFDGVEIGLGYSHGGIGFEAGFEKKFTENLDLYVWGGFGGLNSRLGTGGGLQSEIHVNLFTRNFLSITLCGLVGGDIFTFRDSGLTTFGIGTGSYGLLSLDFRKENVPISLSLGLGPLIYLSETFKLSVYYTTSFSIYIEDIALQIGVCSRFAGFTVRLPLSLFKQEKRKQKFSTEFAITPQGL